jgi:hypothetical protein
VVDELTVTYDPTTTPVPGTEYQSKPCLHVRTRTGEKVATVCTVVSDFLAQTRLLPRLADRPDPDAALGEVLLRWSVARLERTLADPLARQALLDRQGDSWRIGDPDAGEVEELLALADASKTCTHQQADAQDLLCLAASSQDQAVVGTAGRHRVAPTSRPLCAGCQMPDAQVVCSQLSHPEVIGLMTAQGQVRRQLAGALCNLGREEIQQPFGCRAGGHQCWQRVVGLEVAAPTAAAHPRALAEILDALDAWWRLAVVNKPLLRLQGGTSITGLALPCTSRSEFAQRLSELAAVLGNLRVDDDDLRPGLEAGAELPRKEQSLNRLRVCLAAKVSDPDSLERVNQALGRLGRLQRIRSTLQHPAGHDELVRTTAALGLAWPPMDWAAAWERVRAEAVDALGTLRDEMRALTDRRP